MPKKNQRATPELKNSINKIKSALKSTGNRADPMEESMREPDVRTLEMIQAEEREMRYF